MSNLFVNSEPPTAVERFVQDTMDSFKGFFAHLFHGTFLEWWLLDPNGQAYTLFLSMILGVSTWLLILNQNPKSVVASKPKQNWRESEATEAMYIDSEEYHGNEHQPSTPGLSYFPGEETPIMRKLAPPGYRPVNAHIESSPFRVKQPLRPRPGHSAPPVHQSPFTVSSRLSKAFSTRLLQRGNISDLDTDAPISFKSPQEAIMLNEDGTSSEPNTQSLVVAIWSNEGGRRYDRATLRRELATRYLS